MTLPTSPYLAPLLLSIQERFPICMPSIRDAQQTNPEAFDRVAALSLAAATHCFPDVNIDTLAEWYAEFTVAQNRLQRQYDRIGSYPCRSHDDANSAVYQSDESMSRYMASMLLTEFLWPHHLSIFTFYEDHYIKPHSGSDLRILEIAPGHGLLGRVLLSACPNSHLDGVDISPFAIRMSERHLSLTPVPGSFQYTVGDGVNWPGQGSYDLLVAGELLEHLDNPRALVDSIHRLLAPNGRAFVTAAITAAQMDHVTEFKSPEEVVDLFLDAGLVVHEQLVAQPAVVRQGSTRIPRVHALVVGRD